MALALAGPTQTALDAGRIVDRAMILFDLGSGQYGFWSGLGPFTFEEITYVGAGSLIALDGVRQTSDLSAVQVKATLTSIPDTALTPDILATIEAEQYHQRPCTIMTAYFDPDTAALLSVEVEFRGMIDRIVHTEAVDRAAVLECHLESRFRDHTKTGYRMRSDGDQRRINPLDDGLAHVATVHSEQILFGRVSDEARAQQRAADARRANRGFFARLFG
ncbi:DUF2163 domain-containing protein [uncultured Enterovirga sp.]|uniref:DUF2163 domain-containing protein n=1 Tax=uncultured Enterovirga sp. TaxID=2026352 RepID=UPI0035C943AB